MTRTIKRETQIKNYLEQVLEVYGIQDRDDVLSSGARLIVIAPNRFGQGYVRYITSDGEIWIADLKKNNAFQVTCVRLVMFSQNDEIEQKKQWLDCLRKFLQENFRTMNLNDFQSVNQSITTVFNWLVDHGVEVE